MIGTSNSLQFRFLKWPLTYSGGFSSHGASPKSAWQAHQYTNTGVNWNTETPNHPNLFYIVLKSGCPPIFGNTHNYHLISNNHMLIPWIIPIFFPLQPLMIHQSSSIHQIKQRVVYQLLTMSHELPFGKPTVCYWKLPFIVDLPIEDADVL